MLIIAIILCYFVVKQAYCLLYRFVFAFALLLINKLELPIHYAMRLFFVLLIVEVRSSSNSCKRPSDNRACKRSRSDIRLTLLQRAQLSKCPTEFREIIILHRDLRELHRDKSNRKRTQSIVLFIIPTVRKNRYFNLHTLTSCDPLSRNIHDFHPPHPNAKK